MTARDALLAWPACWHRTPRRWPHTPRPPGTTPGITGRLRALRYAPAADELWPDLARSELPTHEFLEAAGSRLRGTGTALAVLDIESDCHPLVLLPATRAGELAGLAAAAGFTAEVYSAADVPETA